jgi:recombinational DNA repair protein (RecF pathway)
MPGPLLQTEAIVLSRKPPAGRFQQLTLFSAQHGGLLCLRRLAAKSASSSPHLDLFDEADFHLETSNQGQTWFLKEVRLIARHDAIGRSYESLREASVFSALIARNQVHEESRRGVYALLRQTLAAFGATNRPDIVFVKALYCFARDEGYPVREDWWPSLPAATRDLAAGVLNQPVAAQAPTPAAVASLTRRLEDYLRGHTEILLD